MLSFSIMDHEVSILIKTTVEDIKKYYVLKVTFISVAQYGVGEEWTYHVRKKET